MITTSLTSTQQPSLRYPTVTGFVILCWLLFGLTSWAQTTKTPPATIVSGKVTEAETGDPIPFAAVVFKGSTTGTNTDFEGKFTLKTTKPVDSIQVVYVGFKTRVKAVQRGQSQTINFQLASTAYQKQEIVVVAGENPAYEIMRRVVRNKDRNDRKNITSYEYEAYNKVEVDIDNIGEKFAKRPIMRKIKSVVDSMAKIVGEDGKPLIPIFISESISKYYATSNPDRTHEDILKTKVKGVGLDEGSFITNIIGSSLQQYNFYDNNVEILGKAFVSPLSTFWRLSYDFELKDSMFVGEDWCYKLIVYPRREADLAFSGTIWITKEDYALKRCDLVTTKTTNINFVSKLKLQQELVRMRNGAWLPSKNRLLVDIANLNDQWAGLLAKSYSSNKNFRINNEAPPEIFEKPIEFAEDAREDDAKFWDRNRHDTLSSDELKMMNMIDTIRKLPVVRTYVEIIDIAINGSQRFGKVDVGPYIQTLAINNVEGLRTRLGFRTNSFWNKKWTIEAFGAYGSMDGRFKGGLALEHIFSRKRWTQAGIKVTHDLEQLALQDNTLSPSGLFYAFTKWADIKVARPFYATTYEGFVTRELFKGFNPTLTVRHRTWDPAFNFVYPVREGDQIVPGYDGFSNTEAQLDIRYCAKEYLLEDNTNQRYAIYSRLSPTYSLRFVAGQANVGGQMLDYQRISAGINHYLNYGLLGSGRYIVEAGLIPSTVPYPLLKTPLGNPFPVFAPAAFNTMNFFEFVNDRWVSVSYQHFFEGAFLNSIPIVKKANLRFTAQGKMLFGQLSGRNNDYNTLQGIEPQFATMDQRPFAEVGYGIENIFRFASINFIHRLSYLERPNARPFYVKVGAAFKL